MHKVGVLFLSCAHWPHRRAPWWRKWSTTERLRPHCCSRQPPSSRRLSVCVGSDCGSNCTESGCDRSSPSRSLSAQFSLSNSSLAVTSSEVSRFCEPSRSFARRGAFFEELTVSSQKLRGSGRNLRIFFRRCGAASHLSVLSRHSAWRCAKKSPAVCLTAGECRLRRAPRGNEGRGAGLALGAGAPCPVRNAIYLFSLGRIEWCRADPDRACFYCEGRNPRSNYLRLRS